MTVSISPIRRPLEALSHYTTLQGMIGIIENGQFWASNVAYLNDREELLHGIKCAEKALDGAIKDTAILHWKEAISSVVRKVAEGKMPNTYATCFCAKPDLLSQWRGYGGSEQGVSLRFEISGLRNMLKGKKSFLVPVEYGMVSGKRSITQVLKDELSRIERDEFESFEIADRDDKVYQVISSLIPRFKHIGFEAELEWRFIAQHETLRDSISFRANKNCIVPYMKIGEESGRLPLRSVYVGPGADTQLTAKSVENFLKAKGYDVPVYISKLPFRT
ncbi:DUF2971 domain-containing protein [Sphingomonas aerolata]|uniref:DUF2971 domain-containing protein n=1 Tax=Sphingomonas aerolata TaxID=185951 RepID=UPI00334DD182